MPIKETLKLNIFQYGTDTITVSQRSGKEYSVKIAALRDKVLSFRVADGYTPKSKLAGTESLMQLMQLLGQSQPLQASYGPMLPAMFSHLAQLMGVRGLEEYSPNAQQAQQNMQIAQAQKAGIDPTTGQPIDQAAAAQAQATAANQQAQAQLANRTDPNARQGAQQ